MIDFLLFYLIAALISVHFMALYQYACDGFFADIGLIRTAFLWPLAAGASVIALLAFLIQLIRVTSVRVYSAGRSSLRRAGEAIKGRFRQS